MYALFDEASPKYWERACEADSSFVHEEDIARFQLKLLARELILRNNTENFRGIFCISSKLLQYNYVHFQHSKWI